MKIIVAGDGKVGLALTRQLLREGHDLVTIDSNPQVLHMSLDQYDVMTLEGNAAAMETLREAGVEEAELLIAATSADETNILCCLTGRILNPNLHTIARVRNPDYKEQLFSMREQLGLSMTINPEMAAAREISRVLRLPSATRVELLANGRAELVELRLTAASPLCGRSLQEVGQDPDINLLICAVIRDDQVHIPKGHFVLQDGDTLYLTGASASFRKAFAKLGLPVKPLRSAMIAGAGRISYYLAARLRREGVHVTVVEENHERAVEFCRSNPECSVMNDNAISYFDSMSGPDIQHTDAFIALTHNDEYNVVAAMYAAALKIPKVISRLSSNSRLKILQKDDRISTVSQEDTAVDIILGYARSLMNAEDHDAVESLYRLMDGRLEFLEFRITDKSPHLEQPIRQWRIKPDTLLACIMREAKTIIPGGDDVIRAGDRVLVVTTQKQIVHLEDIFDGAREIRGGL